ncbi:hypothetical protein A2W32_00460 [candidate division WWE3 bacterium RBG_16_37_10]|uniref:Fibronectin type-III domain-containing protein n=1 Tax=candidate division WWE3 bacterium RBG_16_37_10 TaxID=1802610 RepID=A0A1F4V1L1_UNCKA|nr:MAG: hypothetical protein A2W32_00460 [candidate division WWE3 bacterium RBG_16_37_10]
MLFKKVVKLVLIICLIVIAHLYWTKSVFATSAIEQQINILDQIFYTTSTTDNPTDNSLGLVRWTSGSYTGATVYFEADIKITSLGTVTATLYDSAGNAVSGGTATCTNCTSDLTRSRSSAITLTDGTDYTVRLKTTAGAGLLNSARLIVVQSDATKLTGTESHVELGNSEGKSETSHTSLTNKKLYYYDSSIFTPDPTAYFEASFRPSTPALEQQINIVDQEFYTTSSTYTPTDNSLGLVRWTSDSYTGATVYFEADIINSATGTINAALYDSVGTVVSGSETSCVNCTSQFYRTRSSAITLTNNTDYTVRIKTGNGTVRIRAARLIIIQSNSTKITDTESHIELGNTEGVSATSFTSLTNKKLYNYDSSVFTPTPTASFEASFRPSSPSLEQQINIIDQSYATTSASYVPTDLSLGFIRWTSGHYNSATIYFEADLSISASGTVTAGLFDSSGNAVSGGEASCTNCTSAITRNRSSAITLVDGTNYTVRVKSSNGTGTLKAARLVILQSDGSKLTDTATYIEIGNNVTSITNTTYSDLTDFKIYRYDNNAFSPAPETAPGDVLFHASLKIADAADSIEAELYNSNGTAQVAELTHTGDTTWTLVTAANVDGDTDWDTVNDDQYYVRVKCTDNNGGGCSGAISNAKLVLYQSAAAGITTTEVVHQYINTVQTDADTGYTSKEFPNAFNPYNFGVHPVVYYEATMKTSAGTGYTQLINQTRNTTISSSEITTTLTTYNRVRGSTDVVMNFYRTGDQNIIPQLKNSASNTTSVSSSWLVIQLINIPTSGPTGSVELYNDSDSVSVSGSEVSSTTATFTRFRSGIISLTTAKNYSVRAKSAILINAKLILNQTAAGGVTNTEIVHQYINTLATDSDNGYSDQEVSNAFNPLNFGVHPSVYFEATMKTSAGTGYTQIKNDTLNTAITGTEITTTSTSYARVRGASDIILNFYRTGNQEIEAQIKNGASNTTSVSSSWLIVRLANLPTGGPTGAVELYNDTDTSSISGSEVTSTNSSFTRVRSGSVTLTTAKNYSVRLKSAIIVNAKLVLNQTDSEGVTDTESIQQYINTGRTDSDTSDTAVDNTNQFTPGSFSGGTFAEFFECTLKTTAGTGYCSLRNDTAGAFITGAVLTTTSTSYTRVRSGDVTANMPGTNANMDTYLRNSASNTTSGASSWILIQSSDLTGIPRSPSSLAQYKSDGITSISTGGYTEQTSVVLSFSMEDPNSSDTLTPSVEVRPIGTSFTDTATHSGSAVAYSGSPVTGTVTVPSLTADTGYHWQAKICDAASNCSSWVSYGGNAESAADFTIDTSAPTTPGTPSTTTPTTDTTPSWTWTASTDSGSGLAATPYTVEWCQDSGFSGCGANTATSATNSYTHATALAEGTWYLRVKATDVVGNVSSYSSNGTVVIDTTAPTTPGTPASTSLTTDTTPEWTWTASTDSGVGLATTPYTVDWCQDSGFSGCGSNTSTSSTNSFTHTTALATGTWYFRVKAEDIVGNVSAYSSNGTFTISAASTGDTTKPSKPGTPKTTTPTNNNKPKWTWSSSTDNVALDSDNPYYVQWCKNNNFRNCNSNVDTSDDNSYRHGDALSDGTWYFRVKAKDSSGNYSSYSNKGTVVIDTTAPTITITSTTVTETSISVSWTTNEKSQTIIEWGTSSSYGKSYSKTALTTTHSYNISNLTAGTLYYLKITSKDKLTNTGNVTFQRQTIAPPEDTLITDINVVINSPTSATINWKTNHAATSEIDYGLSTNFTDQTISTDKVVIHSMTLVGLTPDTTYFYEIISVGNTTAVNAFRTFDTPAIEITQETTESTDTRESTSTIDEVIETVEDIVDTITDTIKDITDKITEIIRTEEFNKTTDTVFAIGLKKLIRDLPIPQVIKDIAEKAIEVIKSPQTQKIITFVAVAGNIATALTVLPNIKEIIYTLNQIKHVNILGLLFGLFRKKKNPWGIVYDSQTKQPLDPVILTLTDASGKIYQTISDIYGRYEFIVDPGMYTLSAIKTNYTFPSKLLAGKKDDGIYDNLYFGEPINIQQDQKIQVHIPMDRENVDWNQLEKQKMGIVSRNGHLYKVVDLMFNATLILNILSLSLSYSLEKIIIFSLFVFLYTYHNYIKSHKPWGIVTNFENRPLGGIILRLVHVKFPKISGAIAVTKDNGRYNFLVRKGTYQIVAHKKNPDGTTREINRSKVMDVKKEQGSLGPDFKVDAKEESKPETKQDSATNTNPDASPDNKLDTNNK